MEELIQRLDKWLQENRPDYYAQLAPGLSKEELADFERRLGLELPDDFKLFYQWKNGFISDDPYVPLFYSFSLMDVEEILSFREMMNETLENHEPIGGWNDWNPKWIPFLNDATAERYCLDLNGSFDGKIGQVIIVVSDELDANAALYESFYKWLETMVIAFERGYVVYEPEEEEMDLEYHKAFKALHKENNPGYPLY